MRVWPDDLPGPIGPGYRLSPVDQSIRTDMEVGARRVRRITTARRDRVTAVWKFSDAEMERFRAWFGDEIRSVLGDSNSLSAWTPVAVTVAPDSIIGPSNIFADRITPNSTTGNHGVQRAATVPAAPFVFGATLRSNGLGHARLQFRRADNQTIRADLDLATGAVSQQTNTTAVTVTNRSNGWWRIVVEGAQTAGAASPLFSILAMASANAPSFAGDDVAGIDVAEIHAAARTGFDGYLPTDATGRVLGAAGGSAWVTMPLAFGGGVRDVEARFEGPFDAIVLPGLGWEVSAPLEIRNA